MLGELLGLKKRILVGYDLDDKLSQLSFSQSHDKEPQTLSLVAGAQQYSFPTLLAKRVGEELWQCGHNAEKLIASGDEVVCADNLLSMAIAGEEVSVGGETYDPRALLALFIRRTLAFMGVEPDKGDIAAIVFTLRRLTPDTIETLDAMREYLDLPEVDISYLEYRESFFEYVIHQSADLMANDVILFDHNGDTLCYDRLVLKPTADNTLSWVEEEVYEGIGPDEEGFSQILEEALERRECSSAYLIGKGFSGNWYRKGLNLLCKGRRVFSGNNLYSKGACYGAMHRVHKEKSASKIVYLGRNKLKSELGLNVCKDGKEIYFPLLRGGEDWFDAGGEHEFIIENDNTFTLTISHLDHRPNREIDMILGGIPQRRNKTTRIRLRVDMPDHNQVAIRIEDMGFGEIVPGTRKTWNMKFPLE